MRPIKLKIKGINSFIEEQVIDFEKLTDRGFFGIFGPTGSGKSTVLDGITLALYGEVARESSNYINTNCESGNVSFEFQIGGSLPKRYSVEREFKRDKKTGNPRSGKCKVVDITSGEPVVLADSVNTVKSTCREIIGLNLEDFTRTVVLPQGKFSEFLKLEGRDRRVMLERLFNLEDYGANLDRKLAIEVNKEKIENSILTGELKGYEDISEDREKSKSEEYENSKKQLDSATKEFKIIEKEYLESQEVWSLQSELNNHRNIEKNLKEKENEVEESKKKIKLAECAARVMPHIVAYENTEKEIAKGKENESKLKDDLEVVNIKKINIEEVWNNAKNRKENELPTLILKEQNVKEALEDQKALSIIEDEIKNLEFEKHKLNKDKYEIEKSLESKNKEIIEVNLEVKSCEEKIETLKIDNDFKEKIRQGDRLFEKYNELSKTVKDNINKKEKLESEISQNKISEKELNIKLNEKLDIFRENESLLKELIANVPGNQDDLSKLQNEAFASRETWNAFNRYSKDKEESTKSIAVYKNTFEENTVKRSDLENVIKDIKNKIKELEVENLAHKLREELIQGDTCPVCGSSEHHKDKIKHIDIKDFKHIEEELENKEKELKIVESKITGSKTNILLLEEKIKECELAILGLGDEFKKNSVVELEEKVSLLDKSLKNYNTQKEMLDIKISKIKDEGSNLRVDVNKMKTLIESEEKQLIEIKEELKKNTTNLEAVIVEVDKLKNETGVSDFRAKYKEIIEAEKEREMLLNKVKTYRNNLDILTTRSKEFEKNISETKDRVITIETSIEEKSKSKEEKATSIVSRVGEVDDLEGLLKSIEESKAEIENTFKSADKEKEEIDKSYQLNKEMLIKVSSEVHNLANRIISDKEKLGNSLEEEGFENSQYVKENIMSKEDITKVKEKIDKYNLDLSKTMGAIESVLKKINNRELDEEVWIKIQENKKQKEEAISELNKINIKIEEELKFIREKLEQLQGLLKKRDKLAHKLGLLEDLQKLFKGKKFVEFVATTRLKYVSVEASKRLKEITNGSYGLEADDNGKFIIRDYKNGGSARDASTLSGGEVFLASLALALALSAEIQLKGTAQLELFFLDEGFGTLDDNLLEVVMGSLEKIHNEKLKVGIISHVESIKNRVPVKLMITPAESGRGGSKVKIERT